MATPSVIGPDYLLRDRKMKVIHFHERYMSYKNAPATVDNHKRMETNYAMYSGVNGAQWSQDAINHAIANDRPIHTFNVIQQTIQSLIGVIMENPYSVNFEPTADSDAHASGLLKELWDYDYERGKYKKALTTFTRDFAIHTGVLQLFPDYKNDTQGNIGLRAINPTTVMWDPNWKTDDMGDCGGVVRWSWKSIEELMAISLKAKGTNEDIKIAYDKMRYDATNNTDVTGYRAYGVDYYTTGSNLFKVIEVTYMQKEKRSRVKNTRTGKYVDSMDYKPSAQQTAWMSIQPDHCYEAVEDYIDVCKVFSFVPGLSFDVVLSDGDYPLQTGRLPYFIRSAENLFGERQGKIDTMIDPQIVLNKRESTASAHLDKSAHQNWLAESDAFEGDTQMETNFRRDMSKTGKLLKVGENAINANKIREVTTGKPPTDLWQASDRALSLIDRVSAIAAAQQGRSEGSHESALLFNSKREQVGVQHALVSTVISETLHDIAESYFYAAKVVYSGRRREFRNPTKKKTIVINNRVVDGEGKPITTNNIATLPRQMVRIEEAKSGATRRRTHIAMYTELLGRVRNPLLAADYEIEMVEYLPIEEEKKADMLESAALHKELLKSQMENQIIQNKMAAAQGKAQLDQLMGQGGPTQPSQQNAFGLPPADPRAIAQAPGGGPTPAESGLAGRQSVTNNAPSDVAR